jgi:hypothetical protein
MRYKVFTVIACLTLSALASEVRADWLFNLDVCQTNLAKQDNFEVCVDGDYTFVNFDQGVIAPPGWTQSQRWYDAAANKTCFKFAGPPLPQQSGSEWPWHFGIASSQVSHVNVRDVYWTRGTIASPKAGVSCNVDAAALTATGTLIFVVSNDTESPVILETAAWQTSPGLLPLANLDRGEMPPSSLNTAFEGELSLSPGETFAFTAPVAAGTARAATCFTTVRTPADVLTYPIPRCPRSVSIWTEQALPATAAQVPVPESR